jgi:hypothetical protein
MRIKPLPLFIIYITLQFFLPFTAFSQDISYDIESYGIDLEQYLNNGWIDRGIDLSPYYNPEAWSPDELKERLKFIAPQLFYSAVDAPLNYPDESFEENKKRIEKLLDDYMEDFKITIDNISSDSMYSKIVDTSSMNSKYNELSEVVKRYRETGARFKTAPVELLYETRNLGGVDYIELVILLLENQWFYYRDYIISTTLQKLINDNINRGISESEYNSLMEDYRRRVEEDEKNGWIRDMVYEIDVSMYPPGKVNYWPVETEVYNLLHIYGQKLGTTGVSSAGPPVSLETLLAALTAVCFTGLICASEIVNSFRKDEDEEEESSDFVLRLGKLDAGLTDKHPSQDVKVWIDRPGNNNWEFNVQSPGELDAAINKTGPSNAVVKITGKIPPNQKGVKKYTVNVTAAGKTSLKRVISVETGVEGFRLLSETPIKINASESEKESEIRFTMLEVRNDLLVCYRELLEDIRFTLLKPEDSDTLNAYDTAKLIFKLKGFTDENRTAVYTVRVEKTVPGSGQTFPGKVNALGYSAEGEHNLKFDVELKTAEFTPMSDDKQIEITRTKKIITLYTPLEYNDKFMEILEKNAPVLGARGVHELRRKIWLAAEEGWRKQGHKYLEKSAEMDQYIEALNWTKWVGDLALKALVTLMTGDPVWLPEIAVYYKDLIVSVFIAWQHGYSEDQWFKEYGNELSWKLADVPAEAGANALPMPLKWALYIAYEMCKNLYLSKKQSGEMDYVKSTETVILKIKQKYTGDEAVKTWFDSMKNLLKK